MYDRYADMEKFITDPDKLQIVNGSEVYISSENDYDIVVDLQGRVEEFEQLKPFIVFVDAPYIILEYWGTEENTQFDVVFEHNKGKFLLRSFGTMQDIPENWEEIAPADARKTKSGPSKGFLRKLMEWLSL